MPDTAIGFVLLGIAIVLVLGIVFAISARERPAGERPRPPRGVHMPSPSPLPLMMAVGGSLIGAGLAFRPDDMLANWWLAVPGLLIFVAAAIAWVRAANREWRETEHGSHDDGAAH